MSFLTQVVQDHIFIYWILSLFSLIVDIFTENKLRYSKIPDTWPNIFGKVLFNQFFVSLPCFYLMSNFSDEPLLSWSNLYKFPLTILYEEVMFFFSHVILHTSYLYQNIHKIHHRWILPLAVSALYSHPFEHLFSNMLPVILAPKLAGLGEQATRLWFIIATINTLGAHSGHNNLHDKHHSEFNCNFGVIGLLDYLFGTLRT